MPIPPYLPEMQYVFDDGFTTIAFGLIGSCLVFLLSY